MLYITTRGDRDAFTAHRTLCTDRAPDHGCFIPMRFPKFSEKEINDISLDLSFCKHPQDCVLPEIKL